MPPRAQADARLVLLGGPPGVGKTSVLDSLAALRPDWGLVDADEVTNPPTSPPDPAQRDDGIRRVGDAVQGRFDAGSDTVLLAWVFARRELFGPFESRFRQSRIVRLYLAASPTVLRSRLAKRGDADARYALGRLDLIRKLDAPVIETDTLAIDGVASAIVDHVEGQQ